MWTKEEWVPAPRVGPKILLTGGSPMTDRARYSQQEIGLIVTWKRLTSENRYKEAFCRTYIALCVSVVQLMKPLKSCRTEDKYQLARTQ